MNSLVFLSLMLIPFHTQALSKSEQDCATKNIYFEARSNKQDWLKVLQVANNRKQDPKKYGAKSSHLCDVVHSSQYTTSRFKRIKEPKVYKEISIFVSRHHKPPVSSITYFRSKHGIIKFRSKA